MDNTINVYVDGSVRSNGKDSAFGGIGVYCLYKSKPILKLAKIVKSRTNNESEYLAVINALEALKEYFREELVIYSDSQLIVNQLNDKWEINKPELQHLYNITKKVAGKRNLPVKFKWISRCNNMYANDLAQKITEEYL